MRKTKRKILGYRRKREGKTNYRRRLKILSSGSLRIVVRKSLKNMMCQLIEYNLDGDKVILSSSSKELEKKYGWNFSKRNIPAAYLTGLLLGVKAKKKGVKNAILDIGLNKSVKGCKIYAVLKGVLDAGLEVPHSKESLPDDKALKGEKIVNYFNLPKKNDTVFFNYKKDKKVADLPKVVEETKKKIIEGK